MDKKYIWIAIAILVIPSLVLVPVMAQTAPKEATNEQAINLGLLSYSLIKMDFVQEVDTINTTSPILNFTVERIGKLSLASFTNTISGCLITPDNQTYELETLSAFAIEFGVEGTYTIRIEWGSWIPILGSLIEKITGSGSVDIVINYSIPSKIVNYTMFLIIAVIGGVCITLVLSRNRIKVWLK